MRGRYESLFCYFLFFGSVLIVGRRAVVGWGRTSCLGSAEIASFRSWFFRKLVWLNPEA